MGVEILRVNVLKDGKIIGYATEDSYITWREPIHFFRKYQGFGISKEVLGQLNVEDKHNIIISYIGASQNTTIFKSHIKQWFESGLSHTDQGDLQLFLPVKQMEVL